MGGWYSNRGIIPAIWLIGLGILWLFDLWWPGILILIGITMLIGVANRETGGISANPAKTGGEVVDVEPAAEPEQVAAEADGIPACEPVVEKVEVAEVTSRLPSNCPMCGAPVNENKVVWRGLDEAHCAFCDTKLPLGEV